MYLNGVIICKLKNKSLKKILKGTKTNSHSTQFLNKPIILIHEWANGAQSIWN